MRNESLVINGTDDDLPSSQQSRVPMVERIAGRVTNSGIDVEMEYQIHHLEQEAYGAVLRAFMAQSDSLSWEKEGLMTNFMEELRVSDDEHRELLARVKGDDAIRRIREWRQAGGPQSARFGASLGAHDVLQSSIPTPCKRLKTTHPYLHDFGGLTNEHVEVTTYDPLIGGRVQTRWPEDDFYNAAVTQYNAAEMPQEDIHREAEYSGISYHGARGGIKKPIILGDFIPSDRRRRGLEKDQSVQEFLPIQNVFAKNVSGDIELPNTETLIREVVDKVILVSNPNPLEVEKAKMMLKEQELTLINAIARLQDALGDKDEQKFLRVKATKWG